VSFAFIVDSTERVDTNAVDNGYSNVCRSLLGSE
jgi:hypothetical protein